MKILKKIIIFLIFRLIFIFIGLLYISDKGDNDNNIP